MSVMRRSGRPYRADGLYRLSPDDDFDVRALLRRHAPHNIYLLAQIERGALARDDVAGPMLGYFAGGELVSVAVCGSNLVLSHPITEDAIGAFAQFARAGRYLVRVVVGDDETVNTFMSFYGRKFRQVRLERAGQLLYVASAETLRPTGTPIELRAAELYELREVVRIDRAMVTEELGFDPFVGDLDSYREGWKRRIREMRAWVVGPEGGPLIFKLEQSAVCEDGIQVSGVFTSPQFRRRGVAAHAMSQMCERMFLDVPAVTLYVNEANVAAIRLYEQLGFERAGIVRSVWFDM